MDTATKPATSGLTEEQHANRKKAIGASEAGIACGFPAFNRTQTDLWAVKTGRRQRDEIPEENMERVNIGTKIEALIAELYAERTGSSVQRMNKTYVDKEHSHMVCHIDRLVQKKDRILECKNVDSMAFRLGEWGESGTDEVPLVYLMQCHHMLRVTGKRVCDLAALVGGNKLEIYRIEADAAMERLVVNGERQFWDYVEKDIPPPPSNSTDITLLNPIGELTPIAQCTAEVYQTLQRMRLYGDRRKNASDEYEECKFVLQKYMQGAGILVDQWGMEAATWKNQKDKTVTDWKSIAGDLLHNGLPPCPEAVAQKDWTEESAWNLLISRHTKIKTGNRTFLIKKGTKAYAG